jgi:hypothetical protein
MEGKREGDVRRAIIWVRAEWALSESASYGIPYPCVLDFNGPISFLVVNKKHSAHRRSQMPCCTHYFK